jgi:hypothetical protein
MSGWENELVNNKKPRQSLGFRDAGIRHQPPPSVQWLSVPQQANVRRGYSYNITNVVKILVAKLSFFNRKGYDNNDFHIKECF